MKKLIYILTIGTFAILSSCTDEATELGNEYFSASTYNFVIEDLEGNVLSVVEIDENQTSNGWSYRGDPIVDATHRVNSFKTTNDSAQGFTRFGLEFSLFKSFDENGKDKEDLFDEIWQMGERYDLEIEGEKSDFSSYISYTVLENDEVKEYVTYVNGSDTDNFIEVENVDFLGNRLEDSVYEVDIIFSSRMINIEDPEDIVLIRNGRATLYPKD